MDIWVQKNYNNLYKYIKIFELGYNDFRLLRNIIMLIGNNNITTKN